MRAAISASINDRAQVAFPPSSQSGGFATRTPKRSARNQHDEGARSTLFHVSHSLCRRVPSIPGSMRRRKSHPFPQPSHPPSAHANIFFGRVCYFFRKLTLKPAEKATRIVYENHVQKMWKAC
jgi:hypothetical protein